jgi:hypothetical protein
VLGFVAGAVLAPAWQPASSNPKVNHLITDSRFRRALIPAPRPGSAFADASLLAL